MSSWKKLLKEETKQSVANVKLSEEVRNTPLSVREGARENERKKKTGFSGFFAVVASLFKKKYVAACLAAVLCLCAIVPTVIALSVNTNEAYAVVLEINPSVMFITDKKGNVTGVKSLNADADVILADDEVMNGLCGKPLAESAEAFIDQALMLGYMDFASCKNAVKFSADEDLPFIAESVSAAEKYFCEKGVYSAVIKDITTEEAFYGMTGISAAKQNLGEEAKSVEALSGERNVSDLEQAYDSNVLGGLYKLVSSRIPSIIESAGLLIRMQLKNFEIKACTFYQKDYWDIKDEDNGVTLTRLKNEMAELIAEYTELTNGKYKMRNGWELDNACAEYSDFFGEVVEGTSLTEYTKRVSEYFSSFSFDKFKGIEDKVLDILAKTDVDTMGFETLTRVPSSKKEYVKDLRKVLNELSVCLKKDNKAEYEAEREKISAESYDEYKSKIIDKYGSFENFWQEIKK